LIVELMCNTRIRISRRYFGGRPTGPGTITTPFFFCFLLVGKGLSPNPSWWTFPFQAALSISISVSLKLEDAPPRCGAFLPYLISALPSFLLHRSFIWQGGPAHADMPFLQCDDHPRGLGPDPAGFFFSPPCASVFPFTSCTRTCAVLGMLVYRLLAQVFPARFQNLIRWRGLPPLIFLSTTGALAFFLTWWSPNGVPPVPISYYFTHSVPSPAPFFFMPFSLRLSHRGRNANPAPDDRIGFRLLLALEGSSLERL